MFSIVIQDVDTKEVFKQVRESAQGSCKGCAFDHDASRCSDSPMQCGDLGLIWIPINEKVEERNG